MSGFDVGIGGLMGRGGWRWGRLRVWVRALLLVLMGLGVSVGGLGFGGCRAKAKDFDNENDELRRLVGELESEVERLSSERNEALAQRELAFARLEALEGDGAASALRSLPQCAGIRIGRLSGAVADGDPDWVVGVEVYVRPVDGRRRFVQVAGRLRAEAVSLGEGVGVMPRQLGEVVVESEALREAYRSSALGTHYLVRIPVSEPVRSDGVGRVAVTVEFEDALTGRRHLATEVTDRVYTRSGLD